MADYLIDTNMLDYWYIPNRLEQPRVVARVAAARAPDTATGYVSRFYISAVTLGELEYGFNVNSDFPPAERASKRKFVMNECPEPLPVTEHVAEVYGQFRAWVFDHFSPGPHRTRARRAEQLVDPVSAENLQIQENDLWIAAHALAHNLVLVTRDKKGHFGRLLAAFAATLNVEDWAA